MPSNQSREVPAPLILIPQHFGSIVYDHRTYQYMPFDMEATKLLMRLKFTSITHILDELNDQNYKRQIWHFFEQFYKLGFFTIDQRFAGAILDVNSPPDRLVGPLSLHLEVIDECNLKCKHCSTGKLPRNEQPLTLGELDKLFKSMRNIGTFRLGLTGGEPLLRRELFEIIDLAVAHELSPCLTTNGLLLTEEIVKELGKHKLAWFNVSLEGASPQTHDFIRGKGTFNEVIKHISILSEYCRFSLAFTLMKTNLHEVRACAELARCFGAEAAVFRPLYPVGTAYQHLDLMPSFSEYINALKVLSDMKDDPKTNGFVQLCNIHPWGPETRRSSQSIIYTNFGCGAGNVTCSVSVSGDVSPCSYLNPDYIAGNIKKDSLEDIWNNSPIFRQLRSLKGNNTCKKCNDYAICRGGCRARALALNGSINASDPFCMSMIP
ncbi:MAG: radical SAM protein [Promethearchaeota archaeon]